MPVGFLTAAERDRLSGFPHEIPLEDLFAFFSLTGADHAAIPRTASPPNRLGFALALCAVRYMGFCPDDLAASAPPEALRFVADQLGVAPEAITTYARERPQTRTDHLNAAARHLGWRRHSEADLAKLSGWLVRRALEHDDPALLVRLAADRLRNERVLRPGLWLLERLVAEARGKADEETYLAVEPVLSPETKAALDALLVPVSPSRPSPLARLATGSTSWTPQAILGQLARLEELRAMGADRWDLSGVGPNRLKRLADLGRRHTNQALQRQSPERRYPTLVAFLHESCASITDEVVELFDRCLAQADARARRDLEEFRKNAARATDEKVRLFGEIGRLLLDPSVPDAEVRVRAFGLTGTAEGLLAAVEEAERLARPPDDNRFDFLASRYPYVRQFAPAVLGAFSFRSAKRDDPLLEGVALLRSLNAEGRRRLPDDAPLGFVPTRWGPYVVGADGRIDRRFWELCLLEALRGALRSGDVWVEGSRRYADPQGYLIPKDRWPSVRPEVSAMTGTSPDGQEHLEACRAELREALMAVEASSRQGRRLSRLDEKLLFHQDPQDRSEGVPEEGQALREEVGRRLPKVELIDLLIEADRLTGFLGRLAHASGAADPDDGELKVHLLAAILAQATNLGPVRMAELSGLSYRSLAWATTWHLREETLKAAIAAVVDYHHSLPLSKRWGGGTLSSSDGQRFPVDVKARNAVALPRYFGRGRGVTFYSWTSDQFSQYGTKVIPSTVRDATHVLDGILGNETELPIAEHTVDTHGYTVMWTLSDPRPGTARRTPRQPKPFFRLRQAARPDRRAVGLCA